MTGTRSLFILVRNCFGLVTGSCDRNKGVTTFHEKPPRIPMLLLLGNFKMKESGPLGEGTL